MHILTDLFLTFAKVGMFTFGGGYAMISIIENVCVERKQWITHEEMMQMTVIAESTPGHIAINCATYVGCKQAGIPGSIAATVGIVLPSFVILYLISTVLDNFLEITLIANAFQGIKIAVGILIVNAGLNMLKKLPKNVLSRTILVCSLCAMLAIDIFSLRFSTISLMLAAGVVGICAAAFKKGGEPA